MSSRGFTVRELTRADRTWVGELLVERWGAREVVSRGRLHDASESPGFAACDGGRPIGLVTYAVEGDSCELVTLDSVAEGAGVGTALVEATAGAARAAGCSRLWVITTNDNLPALGFYQKRGVPARGRPSGRARGVAQAQALDPARRPGRDPAPGRARARAPTQRLTQLMSA